jgi:hypothetical protein
MTRGQCPFCGCAQQTNRCFMLGIELCSGRFSQAKLLMFPTELIARSESLGDKVYVGEKAVDLEFKLVTIEDEETTYTVSLDMDSAKIEPEDGTTADITNVPNGSFALEIAPGSGVLTNVGNTTTITVSMPPAPKNFLGKLQVKLVVYNSFDGSRQELQITTEVGALAHTLPRHRGA